MSMTEAQAFAAIRSWTEQGWHFVIRTQGPAHWSCNVVGRGLAHAHCGGARFEDAVALALGLATAMEDDPDKLLAAHRSDIERELRAAFGPDVTFRFEICNSAYDDDAKKINLIVLRTADITTHIERECDFHMRSRSSLPQAIWDALILSVEHLEEKKEGSPA